VKLEVKKKKKKKKELGVLLLQGAWAPAWAGPSSLLRSRSWACWLSWRGGPGK